MDEIAKAPRAKRSVRPPFFPETITLDLAQFSNRAPLSKAELSFIDALDNEGLRPIRREGSRHKSRVIDRLVEPLDYFFEYFQLDYTRRLPATRAVIRHIQKTQKPYWEWTATQWLELGAAFSDRVFQAALLRQLIPALAFHFCGINITSHFDDTRRFAWRFCAFRFWGTKATDDAVGLVTTALKAIGYIFKDEIRTLALTGTIARFMVVLNEPNIDLWSESEFRRSYESVRSDGTKYGRSYSYAIWLALHHRGNFSAPPQKADGRLKRKNVWKPRAGCSQEWLAAVDYYAERQSVQSTTRKERLSTLYFVGRWLNQTTPEILGPKDWIADTALRFVAMVVKAKVGDFIPDPPPNITRDIGQRLRPYTVMSRLSTIRQFFYDLQDWDYIPRRFNPRSVFRVPESIKRQAQPSPRDLEDDVWAKLLYAGLTLEAEDIGQDRAVRYPKEMWQAIAIVWVFCALRQTELRRLRPDCISWEVDLLNQSTDGAISSPVCFLLVPAGKYKPEFRKPVDGIVGRAIESWLAVRSQQPDFEDPKTGKMEPRLFANRGSGLGSRALSSMISTLCEKAGIPEHDAKGKITSHRARSTIATQLVNAPEPMTPYELRDWLGHSSIRSTEWYAGQRPKQLAKKFLQANYWRENMARISVIVDRHAIESGAAAKGAPYHYYDLEHGFCTDRFFSRCEHRMACAGCGYYLPKDSHRAQQLEADKNNERLAAEFPLREDERLALSGDAEARRKLLARLANVPTNDGRTPTEISSF